MQTSRGFEIMQFYDDSDQRCTLQESSNIEPHIWLGVHDPRILIMYQDAVKNGLGLPKMPGYEDSGPAGWCELPIPKETLVESRMNLNPEQARILAEQLLYFAEHGYLPTSDKENLWEKEVTE